MRAWQPRKSVWLVGRLGVLALGLLLGSCSLLETGSPVTLAEGFAELRETAQVVIAEPGRRDHFIAHCQALEAELLDFERYATDFAVDYRRAFTDYDTDQDELHRLSTAFRERQRVSQQRFVVLHLAMAESVTDQEWRSLRKVEAKIVESLLDRPTGASG